MFIIEKLKEHRRKKILKNIRESFKVFGHDLSDISDEDLESGILKAAEGLGSCGVTCTEAIRALVLLIKEASND